VPPTPHRYFLVHAPADRIEAIDRAVRQPAQRERIVRELAAAGLPHQRAAALSERVAGDVRKRPQARDNPPFAFAAGNLPYLLAATDPHAIAVALDHVRSLGTEADLLAFFAAEAERLGLQVRKPDPAIAPPQPALFEAYVREQIDRIAAGAPPAGLRRLFAARPALPAAQAAGAALAELLGRLGPTWSEGRGRWLGALIRTAPDAVHDEGLLAGMPIDPAELRTIFGMPDPASAPARALRAALLPAPAITKALHGASTSTLLPAEHHEAIARELGEGWEALGPHAARWFLSEDLGDWRRLLLAALHTAHGRDEPLLEARDVYRYGYRWPAV
jgi:hypothetical protein